MSTINTPSSSVIPQESALRVVKGSLGAAVAATTLGSLYGVAKAQPATLYAFQSGANTFVFAFPFFALREYVISPLLDPNHTEQSIHTKNIVASAISGSMVGGAMAAYFRGPKKFIPGLTTFGILATTLQFVGNELRVARVHMLAGRGIGVSDVEVDDSRATSKGFVQPPAASNISESAHAETRSKTQNAEEVSVTTSSWLNRAGSYLSSFSPVRKITDQEYEEQLRDRRRQVLERLKEVEGDIASEEVARKKV